MFFSKKEGKEVKKKKQDGCVHEYSVSVNAGAYDELEKLSLTRLQSVVSLPGFRQGKVPLEMLKEKFPEKLREKMFDISARDAVNRIIQEDGLVPVVTPLLTSPQFTSENLAFNLRLECAPKFEVRDYTGIKAKKTEKKISDAEVDEYLEQIRNFNAYLKPAPGDAPAEKKHFVVYDIEAYDGENRISEHSAQNEIIALEAPGKSLAGLPEALLGSKKGETREFETEAAGKKLRCKITVKEIKEKALPELDEQFLAQFGAKSVEELRENVRKMLQQQEDEKAEKEVIRQIEDALMERNRFDLPPTLVDEEAKELVEILKKRMPQAARDSDDSSLKEKLRPAAERNLRVAYILNAIARKEKISAGESDWEKEMENSLRRLSSEDEKQKVREVFKSRKEYIMAMITENKAMGFVREKAEIKTENADAEAAKEDK